MAKKVLLIEDEKMLSEMYEARLKKEGFEVLSTMSAESALELIKKKKPDLILLDLLLPGIQGQEVLKILKKGSETKDIPIIVFSNYDTPEVRKESARYKTKYILKANVTTKDLVEIIKEELSEIDRSK